MGVYKAGKIGGACLTGTLAGEAKATRYSIANEAGRVLLSGALWFEPIVTKDETAKSTITKKKMKCYRAGLTQQERESYQFPPLPLFKSRTQDLSFHVFA